MSNLEESLRCSLAKLENVKEVTILDWKEGRKLGEGLASVVKVIGGRIRVISSAFT